VGTIYLLLNIEDSYFTVSNPLSGSAVLLPLTPENNYTPEVMICGGSAHLDSTDPSTFSSQFPASAQCSRLLLTAEGIAAGWKVEHMPQARVMPDMVLLPDGRVVIVNGAQTGFAGIVGIVNREVNGYSDNF
jgi:hypothetical protein